MSERFSTLLGLAAVAHQHLTSPTAGHEGASSPKRRRQEEGSDRSPPRAVAAAKEGHEEQALNGEFPSERATPPSDMASGKDATTTIGIEPGRQAPLRRSCPHPEHCHPSPYLDNESWGRREHEIRCSEIEEASTGKFRAGQSVLHWSARWFKSATQPPIQLNKKLRPMWLDSTVVMVLGVRLFLRMLGASGTGHVIRSAIGMGQERMCLSIS